MRHRDSSTNISFIDMMMNITIILFVLFILSFLLINLKKANDGIKPKAEYIISIEWAKDVDADVDLWVQDPEGNVVNFRNKEGGVAYLDRDSLGQVNNNTKLADGSWVKTDNREVVSIRGVMPGEWTVNVHLYAYRGQGGMAAPNGSPIQPVPVKVTIEKVNPSVQLLIQKEIVLERVWDEKTASRFTMSHEGTSGWVTDYKQLIRSY